MKYLLTMILIFMTLVVSAQESEALPSVEYVQSKLIELNNLPKVIIIDQNSPAESINYKMAKLKNKMIIEYTDVSTLLLELSKAQEKGNDPNLYSTEITNHLATVKQHENAYKTLGIELDKLYEGSRAK